MEHAATKSHSYRIVEEHGKVRFRCLICGLLLSSRQRILMHLANIHSKSPLKRERKKYLDDPFQPVPIRTQMRRKSLSYQQRQSEHGGSTAGIQEPNVGQEVMEFDHDDRIDEQVLHSVEESCDLDNQDIIDHPHTTLQFECAEEMVINCTETEDANPSDGSYSDENDLYLSSSSDSSASSFDSSDYSNSEDENISDTDLEDENTSEKLPASEITSLCLLSYICKYKCSAKSVDDLLYLFRVLKTLFPDSTGSLPKSFKDLLGFVSSPQMQSIHYCSSCSSVFPEDSPEVFKCNTNDCNGMRYIGSEHCQSKPNRRPKCFFIIADVESQLKQLLSKTHIWKAVKECKQQLSETSNSAILQDIIDGQSYRNLSCPGGFLDPECDNISCSFNTDGIPLFSSSGSKLWPIFLVINELPPAKRFARENVILAGIWQGKNKPPFFQYLSALGEILCRIHSDGVMFYPNDLKDPICSKLAVLIGCVDLQAKGYIVNMSMHNGEYGCITCEEPGVVTKQGKGHSRSYPYKEAGTLPLRNSEDIKQNKAPISTRSHRIKGICGCSGLQHFPCFDYVTGLVPDYMHGVLLGVTKSLLYLWMSPTHSKKPHFIGKQINKVSKRLQEIKPPDYVERLPRDLEKHYKNLKATELQAWLLHYSLPCLHGILPDLYLNHFALFSEGIHILLCDRIDQEDLLRAEYLLDLFYKGYAELYGAGNCGLNVHNIGSHLVYYVRQWGPLFSWNCFGFEDFNAKILQYAHGTGDVTSQIMIRHNANLTLAHMDTRIVEDKSLATFISKMTLSSNKCIKVTKKAANCYISGACKAFSTDMGQNMETFIRTCCKAEGSDCLQKILRITVRDEKFYGTEYTKMRKRQCNVVLTKSGDIMRIVFFVLNVSNDIVYAVGHIVELKDKIHLYANAGHHIICVNNTNTPIIVQAEDLVEKLFFVQVDGFAYVSKVPNHHGYGVLK